MLVQFLFRVYIHGSEIGTHIYQRLTFFFLLYFYYFFINLNILLLMTFIIIMMISIKMGLLKLKCVFVTKLNLHNF
jgi:hypothetical protein